MKKLRGRPDHATLPQHRERLLEAASREFFGHGYKGASLDRIAANAGVSKVTIYRRHGNKAGLFEAIALRSVEQLRRQYRGVQTQGRDPREVLMEFGLAAYEGSTRPDTVAVVRLALGEASRFPAIAKTLWDHRFETLAPLASYLSQLKAEGRVDLDDPMHASVQFSGMVSGGIGSVMEKPLRNEVARRRWVESAVDIFLYGCLGSESTGRASVKSGRRREGRK
jgi:AcrR family transcriptional regulator